MKKLFYGIFIAAAVMMSSVAFANPFMDTGVLNADPVYAPVALIVTDPPLVPAVKPNNDGLTTAMAGGNDVDKDDNVCNMSVTGMAVCKRTLSVGFFQLNTDNRIPKTVLAVGAASELDDVPTKIPI